MGISISDLSVSEKSKYLKDGENKNAEHGPAGEKESKDDYIMPDYAKAIR